MTLKGITNGQDDPGTDVFRAVTVDVFRAAGLELTLSVKQRAVGPEGRGAVALSVTPLPKGIERPLKLTDEGMVRRVRGVAWTCRMAPAFAYQLLSAAKGVLLKLLSDVTIFTDTVSAPNVRRGTGWGEAWEGATPL